MTHSHPHHSHHGQRVAARPDEPAAAGAQRQQPGNAGGRRLISALAILVAFTIVEAVGGYLANSIALLAEAVHMPSYQTQFFRSAAGWRTPTLDHVLARRQKQLLPITDFGFDTNVTRHTYPKWVDRTLQAARRDRGGIFVLHDGRLRFWGEPRYDPRDRDSSANRGWVPEAAAMLIQRCRAEGFRFLEPQLWRKEPGARS